MTQAKKFTDQTPDWTPCQKQKESYMSDPLEDKDVTGVTSTNRHSAVRWHAGSESGDILEEDLKIDGCTLTIEISGEAEVLAIIEAISKQTQQ